MPENRIKTGQGRVEYLANKPVIHELLSKGYTLMSIYEKFKKEGKMTMSYKTLNMLVKGQTNEVSDLFNYKPRPLRKKKITKKTEIMEVQRTELSEISGITENSENSEKTKIQDIKAKTLATKEDEPSLENITNESKEITPINEQGTIIIKPEDDSFIMENIDYNTKY